MRANEIRGPVIAVAVIMALLGAGAVYTISREGPVGADEEPVELGPLTRRMSSLTSATVAEMGSSDNDRIRETMASLVGGWVETSQMLVPGYTVDLLSSDVLVTDSGMTASLPVPPTNLETRNGMLRVNSEMFGDSGAMPLVPSLRTNVRLSLRLTPVEGDGTKDMDISYSVLTVDMERALIRLLELLESDMNGWSSGLARDVEYMLNSLVRTRARAGVGTSFSDSNFHLLNEGDVELAFNFALAVRMARWTGSVPGELVSDIDLYFAGQSNADLMNPTGARNWAESEKENFEDYITRSRGEIPRRRADDLMSVITSFGHADTADIFLRYLYMDRSKDSIGRKEPVDLNGPLEEGQLIDPRQPTETIDPYSLEHHPVFPSSRGMKVHDDLMEEEGEERSFKPVFSSGLMVAGRDLNIKGVNSFKAFFTTADLKLTDSDLISYGNSTGPTRCGAIPPPPEPPSRDYRVQWDLVINGSVPVKAESSGWSGNTYDPSSVTKEVRFEIPVRVHTGTGRLYPEGFPGLFNINTGSQFTTAISGGWVITPEANATEYFADRAWPELKEAMAAVTGLARVSGWTENVLEPVPARRSFHAASLVAMSSLESWIEETDLQTKLFVLNDAMIAGPGIDINDIGPVMLDGHEFTLSYSPARDRMQLTSSLPEGSIKLLVWPISGGEMKVEARVLTDQGTRIELDLNEGTFSIHGNFGGSEVNEGSLIAEPPADSVWRMLGRNGMISSPTIELTVEEAVSPYFGSTSLSSDRSGKVLLSVLLAGDTNDAVLDLNSISEDDILSMFRKAVPVAQEHGLAIGIRMEFSGDGAPDIGRTFMFSSLTVEDLNRLERSEEPERLLLHMVTSSRMPYPGTLGEEMIFTETAPAWTMQAPGVEGSRQITSVVRISPLGGASFSYFTGDTGEAVGSETWSSIDNVPLSPLW